MPSIPPLNPKPETLNPRVYRVYACKTLVWFWFLAGVGVSRDREPFEFQLRRTLPLAFRRSPWLCGD